VNQVALAKEDNAECSPADSTDVITVVSQDALRWH